MLHFYSPSSHFKPVRPSFIFGGSQIKIFLMKSESFLTLHIAITEMFPERSMDISVSSVILWSYKNTFCVQRKQNKEQLYSTILLLQIMSSAIIESIPARKQCMHVVLSIDGLEEKTDTHTHARTRTHAHAHTHAHTRMHAHTHTRSYAWEGITWFVIWDV